MRLLAADAELAFRPIGRSGQAASTSPCAHVGVIGLHAPAALDCVGDGVGASRQVSLIWRGPVALPPNGDVLQVSPTMNSAAMRPRRRRAAAHQRDQRVSVLAEISASAHDGRQSAARSGEIRPRRPRLVGHADAGSSAASCGSRVSSTPGPWRQRPPAAPVVQQQLLVEQRWVAPPHGRERWCG